MCYSSAKANYNVSNYSLPRVVLKDIYDRRLSINDIYEEQSIFHNEIKTTIYGRNPHNAISFPMKLMGEDDPEKFFLKPSKIRISKLIQSHVLKY